MPHSRLHAGGDSLNLIKRYPRRVPARGDCRCISTRHGCRGDYPVPDVGAKSYQKSKPTGRRKKASGWGLAVALTLRFLAPWFLIWPGLSYAIPVNPVEAAMGRKAQIDVPFIGDLIGGDIKAKFSTVSGGIFKDIVVINPTPNIETFLFADNFLCVGITDEEAWSAEDTAGSDSSRFGQFPIRKVEVTRQFRVSQFMVHIDDCLACRCLPAIFEKRADSVSADRARDYLVYGGSNHVGATKLFHQNFIDGYIGPQLADSSALRMFQRVRGNLPERACGKPKSGGKKPNNQGEESSDCSPIFLQALAGTGLSPSQRREDLANTFFRLVISALVIALVHALLKRIGKPNNRRRHNYN